MRFNGYSDTTAEGRNAKWSQGEGEPPRRMTVKDELRDARLVAAWYATTHGDRLDHDAHCPAGWVPERRRGPSPTCTCGWADAGPALERLADLAYERANPPEETK